MLKSAWWTLKLTAKKCTKYFRICSEIEWWTLPKTTKRLPEKLQKQFKNTVWKLLLSFDAGLRTTHYLISTGSACPIFSGTKYRVPGTKIVCTLDGDVDDEGLIFLSTVSGTSNQIVSFLPFSDYATTFAYSPLLPISSHIPCSLLVFAMCTTLAWSHSL